MCGGIEVAGRYTESGKPMKVYSSNTKAALPVLQADGSVEQDGHLPATGWARVDSIRAGKWARFHPRDVRIVAEHFMEKDPAGVSHWLRNCTPLNHQFALALTTDCVRLDQSTPPVAIGKERPRLCKNVVSDGNQLAGDFLSVQEAVGGPLRRNR